MRGIQLLELFSEPSGWEVARIQLITSLTFFSMYTYYELLHSSGLAAILVLGAASGIAGIAEMLPNGRRYVASVLRIVAIGVLVALMALSLHRLAT